MMKIKILALLIFLIGQAHTKAWADCRSNYQEFEEDLKINLYNVERDGDYVTFLTIVGTLGVTLAVYETEVLKAKIKLNEAIEMQLLIDQAYKQEGKLLKKLHSKAKAGWASFVKRPLTLSKLSELIVRSNENGSLCKDDTYLNFTNFNRIKNRLKSGLYPWNKSIN